MYPIHMDLMALVIAFKRELLLGFVGGMTFSLVGLLLRPLNRWLAPRSEVRRLLYLDRQRSSTYLLIGLASGAWFAGILVLIPLLLWRRGCCPGSTSLSCFSSWRGLPLVRQSAC